MSIYLRENVWYTDFTVNGRRVRQSTNTENKQKAQQIHDELKVSLRKKKESGKTLSDAIKLWLNAKPRSDRARSEIRIFRSLYPSRPLSEVDGHDILDALEEKSAANYNKITNNIRAAINLAVERKWCEPIKIYKRDVQDKRLRFLSKIEWNKIYSFLPHHLKPIASFAISTGLRQANVLGLKWDSIDLDRGVAWVDALDTKAKRSIAIPLSKYALSILKAQKKKHNVYVFTYKGEPIESIKTSWNNALVKAKIDLIEVGRDENNKPIYRSTFRWHDLRHTWASWHVMNGTPLPVLKELGGWADIAMVLRYAHLSPEYLQKYASNGVT